ncbi:outer membrane beta-barrel protein [Ideonella livida]|uniref:Outer membrane beta-barrel protein n=1 Tax=Ideonella livida TaxID=2707176 RepID=A0A7C9TP39_9BURK|nr:outer membrane beta-barrel protein [Ideonella livida]NDY93226.1 outer membrane beta-barrel protein [Ideonella livida]
MNALPLPTPSPTPLARACVLACSLLAGAPALAGEPEDDGPPAAPYALFERFNAATGWNASGYLQLGWSANDASTHNQAAAGHSNFPVVGPADEGLQLNALALVLERPMARTNLLPRITPTPGPVPWEFDWGVHAELTYGRNGLPAGMLGLDAEWGLNRTPAGTAPGSTRQNYLALPQVFAQAYLPVGLGVAFTVGRFGSGVGSEIPPDWRPGPNFFYSKAYAMVAQPDQVAGVLASANLMRSDWGLLMGEAGVVNGRQNWQDNNGDKSWVGALRWRSGDMATWVDYSFMRGNEQNEPGGVVQMPVARLISPRGQLRQHHSLSFTSHPANDVELHGELLWGRQDGDGRADTIDVLTGPGFAGGSWRGANARVLWRTAPDRQWGARLETFQDRQAQALFPVTAVAGDFNALTLGLRQDLTPNVVLRPEIRHDWQSHHGSAQAFGGGRASRQTTLSADVLVFF